MPLKIAFELKTSLLTTARLIRSDYITYTLRMLANSQSIINNHFRNVYLVTTLLWAKNEIENNKLFVEYLGNVQLL